MRRQRAGKFEELVIEKWQPHFNGVSHIQTLTCQDIIHKQRLHPQIDNQIVRRAPPQILAPVELFEKLTIGVSAGKLLSKISRDQRIEQAEFLRDIIKQAWREGEDARDSFEPRRSPRNELLPVTSCSH